MGQDCLTQRYTETAKEEEEEGWPHQILQESTQKVLFPKTIFKQREANIARTKEHDHSRKPNLETMHVEPIHRELETE